ncbi:uncharacterized protein [Typha angustifolia]|uniref:uncharacterized protein n=1 Tax=Typha angustifolia TaxID=59011 RepID=UPI003C2EC2BC
MGDKKKNILRLFHHPLHIICSTVIDGWMSTSLLIVYISTCKAPRESHSRHRPSLGAQMAAHARAKRATEPLDDAAKARLRTCCASSGSDYEAALSGLVHAFLEPDCVAPPAAESDGGEESDDTGASDAALEAAEEVRKLLDPYSKGDPFRIRLYGEVVIAVEALLAVRPRRSSFRRAVMARLRERGYNAGFCKARWDQSKGMAEGNYEYIDVEVDEKRYIIDVGFASEFEVARSTEGYRIVTAAMPEVVVARPEEVRRAVKIAADEARRSLRRQGLSVPPWRMRRFMIAKWLGPYRRTVSPLTASAGTKVASGGEVKCRAVGFAPPEKETTSGSKSIYYY